MITTDNDLGIALNDLDIVVGEFKRITSDPKHYNNPLMPYLESMVREIDRARSMTNYAIYQVGGLS